MDLKSIDVTLKFEFVGFDCITGIAEYEIVIENLTDQDMLIADLNLTWYYDYSLTRYPGQIVTFSGDPTYDSYSVDVSTTSLDIGETILDRLYEVGNKRTDINSWPNGSNISIGAGESMAIADLAVHLQDEPYECVNLLWDQSSTAIHGDIWGRSAYNINSFGDMLSADHPEETCFEGRCNVPEICDDGLDNDLDGLIDCEDSDCTEGELTLMVSLDSHSSCAEDQGQISVRLPEGYALSDYTICIGDVCAGANGILSGLSAGDHRITITNTHGCTVPYVISPEICGNDIDDDGDGYADCEDLDCILPVERLKPIKEEKSINDCMSYTEDLLVEIDELMTNSEFTDPCNSNRSKKEIVNSALLACGNGCDIDGLYMALAENEIIIVDESLINCPRVKCIYDKLFANETDLFCESLGKLFDDANVTTIIKIGSTDGSGGTLYNEVTGIITITLSSNYDCQVIEGTQNYSDLDIVATIIHEAYHAQMFQELINAGYNPNSIDTYKKLWDNYYVNHFSKVGTYSDAQHAIMVFTDNFIQRLATALFELNQDPSLSWRNFQRLAWEGLDYVHPDYDANRDYLEGGDIYGLHLELLDKNPNLTLNCND